MGASYVDWLWIIRELLSIFLSGGTEMQLQEEMG